MYSNKSKMIDSSFMNESIELFSQEMRENPN